MSAFTNKVLEDLLKYSSAKQKVISENLSNLNTKGYKRKDVEFKEFMNANAAGKLKATNDKHIQIGMKREDEIVINQNDSSENTSGFNNVNVDQEMAEMAQNTIMFKFAARKLHGYYQTLQKVIKGN